MLEVERLLGAEDAVPLRPSAALEAPGVGGAAVLEGGGGVDGGGLGAGTAPPPGSGCRRQGGDSQG